MRTIEEIKNIRKEILETPWKDDKLGHARAYLVAACTVYIDGECTWYHYPAFYLIHHSLELIIKNSFSIKRDGHLLIPLLKEVENQDKFFDKDDYIAMETSDEYNRGRGQLRYHEENKHKKFNWDIFYDLILLAKKLLKNSA